MRKATTSDVFESCTRGAKSDRSLGWECDNQPDAATRKACNRRSRAAKDALATCGDERTSAGGVR
jgi:hypothetical protein